MKTRFNRLTFMIALAALAATFAPSAVSGAKLQKSFTIKTELTMGAWGDCGPFVATGAIEDSGVALWDPVSGLYDLILLGELGDIYVDFVYSVDGKDTFVIFDTTGLYEDIDLVGVTGSVREKYKPGDPYSPTGDYGTIYQTLKGSLP